MGCRGGATTGGSLWSTYLIDDISVIDCGNVPHAGNDTTIRSGDSVFLGTNEMLIPYTWYVAGNPTPIDSGGGIWVHPIVTTVYVVEQANLCGEGILYDTVTVVVDTGGMDTTTHHVNGVPTRQLASLAIYPNPAASSLAVENAMGYSVVIYNVVGERVYSEALTTNKEVLNISNLRSGLYFVHVVDRVTGYEVVREVLKE